MCGLTGPTSRVQAHKIEVKLTTFSKACQRIDNIKICKIEYNRKADQRLFI